MNFDLDDKSTLVEFSHSSLTDIVMSLLIFFLLTSQFVVLTGVKVTLPGSKANSSTDAAQIVVVISEDKSLYVNTEYVVLSELENKLKQLKTKINTDNLIIKADKSVPVELIIKVIDAGKLSGLGKFTLQTEKKLE
ncbi:MAG TPA: biopolymer transporter ExbD [Ignavibacteriales bacterium]|nr:biopolymer transporter ExbD [Ignavibacteriales bacterium]HOL80606.1 biopolymer transporter ExbD [Ignavibacteriales bacterium]HOM64294.1 biopolymer transporter ExbD [Ignavibacteriales bacterium]HPD68046.1 biopolymer transporter ExbD [Ignavibacteriales bacterium]HPP33060.1 biopolymer transporter ExbD [Ignavibacteriales bacterium]